MFYQSELQLINKKHSMEASMQFTSRFLDLTLRSWAGCIQQLSLVVWQFALMCDGREPVNSSHGQLVTP